MQTVSERSAWIRRGWEDYKNGWTKRENVPDQWQSAYLQGWRRAQELDKEWNGGEQG